MSQMKDEGGKIIISTNADTVINGDVKRGTILRLAYKTQPSF